jgi:hypothetical protein
MVAVRRVLLLSDVPAVQPSTVLDEGHQPTSLQAGALAVIVLAACTAQIFPGTFSGWLVEHRPLIRVSEFVLGALVTVDVAEERWPKILITAAVACAILAYLAAGVKISAFSERGHPGDPVHGAHRQRCSNRALGKTDLAGSAPDRMGWRDLLLLLLNPRARDLSGRRSSRAGLSPIFVISLIGSIACAALLHYVV